MSNVNGIFLAAGWRPLPGPWSGGFELNTLVGGIAPDGAHYVKDWAAISPGHELYCADTPDTPLEAAQWLIRHVAKAADGDAARSDTGVDILDEQGSVYDLGADILDAEYENAVAAASLPAPNLHASESESSGYEPGAFIFGDDLEQRRSQRMGDVYRIALALMPDGIDYAKLAELRNFAMGVSESRWSDNTQTRAELDLMESRVRRGNEITAARDAKIADLLAADRSGIESYDPTSGWPA